MNKERLFTLTLIILAAAASRLLPHPDNVTPIAAIALFAGAHFERKWLAFFVPLSAMLLSNAIIGFYDQMYVTYIAFALIVCIGFVLRGKRTFLPVVLATLAGSVSFFLITNCALWIHNDLYPKTIDGIITGYVMAIPFFKNTLIGDLFYSGLLFGGFALAERRFTRLQPRQPANA